MAFKASLAAILVLLALSPMLLLGGCERAAPEREAARPAVAGQEPAGQQLAAPAATTANTEARPAPDAAQAAGGEPIIVALGDSLTAGYGLSEEVSYPSFLQQRLRAAGYPHRVVNAGLSGDTTAGGVSRTDWLLRQFPEIVILALGGNDGLRGFPIEVTRKNLATIIEKVRATGARVLLAGMKLPSNYGRDYTRGFAAIFPELARQYDLPFLPFLLEGVALQGRLNQADGMHPNAEGSKVVAENVWRVLKPILEK